MYNIQNILESIEELKDMVGKLEGSVNSIEANIKMINNRIGMLGKEKNALQKDFPVLQAGPVSVPEIKISDNLAKETQAVLINKPNALVYKKVFGKLIDNNKEPLDSVLVKIYDKNNEVCATAETDVTGFFTTMLKPGKYVAEYNKIGFKAINKNFDVDINMNEIELK